jgi:hypothetical protein
MTKAKSTAALKKSPVKATMPTRIPNPYTSSPKKNDEEKKNSHNIIPLVDNNGTPYSWAFEKNFNAKDFVKDLLNRNNALIFLGGLEFKAFSNLTTRWVKSSLVGGCLWVIRIDMSKDGMTGSFPMSAHIPYANKIAQAVIQENTFEGGKVDVVMLNLTESQMADLNSYFSITSFNEAREAIFQESIQAASAAMESLI